MPCRSEAAASLEILARTQRIEHRGVDVQSTAAVRRDQGILSAGSSSSEMSRMLESAVGSGIPAQWVRNTR